MEDQVLLIPFEWSHEPKYKTKKELTQARKRENLALASTFANKGENKQPHRKCGRLYILSDEMNSQRAVRLHLEKSSCKQAIEYTGQQRISLSPSNRAQRKEANELSSSYSSSNNRNNNNDSSANISSDSGNDIPEVVTTMTTEHGGSDPSSPKVDRKGRTRTKVMKERQTERLQLSNYYETHTPKQPQQNAVGRIDPNQMEHYKQVWLHSQEENLENTAKIIANSTRLGRLQRKDVVKFDGNKERTVTVKELLAKREKNRSIPESVNYCRPSSGEYPPRRVQTIRWTDAQINFNHNFVGNTELMDKVI